MRAARSEEEVTALEERVRRAEAKAESRGASEVIRRFRAAVSQSSAVINRPLGLVNQLVSSDNEIFGTFYKAVSAEMRIPEANAWDKIRQSVDALLFPYYADHIRFAALTIDGRGVPGFGSMSLTLKESTIRERASVFEENSIEFIRRHRIVPGDVLPLGYRAPWSMRDSLAIAKLEEKIQPTADTREFPGILLTSVDGADDFVEVHVYGPIHRRGIARLSGATPRKKADKVLFESVKKKLQEVGAEIEVQR